MNIMSATREISEKEIIWYCCSCDDTIGGMSLKLHPECLCCGRKKCNNCEIELVSLCSNARETRAPTHGAALPDDYHGCEALQGTHQVTSRAALIPAGVTARNQSTTRRISSSSERLIAESKLRAPIRSEQNEAVSIDWGSLDFPEFSEAQVERESTPHSDQGDTVNPLDCTSDFHDDTFLTNFLFGADSLPTSEYPINQRTLPSYKQDGKASDQSHPAEFPSTLNDTGITAIDETGPLEGLDSGRIRNPVGTFNHPAFTSSLHTDIGETDFVPFSDNITYSTPLENPITVQPASLHIPFGPFGPFNQYNPSDSYGTLLHSTATESLSTHHRLEMKPSAGENERALHEDPVPLELPVRDYEDHSRASTKRKFSEEDPEDESGNKPAIIACDYCLPKYKHGGDAPLACHFYKRDPKRYLSCILKKFWNISSLRQHLDKDHKLGPHHCRSCWGSFDDQESLEAHKGCQPTGGVPVDRLGKITKERGVGPNVKWFWTWKRLFGDATPPPKCPYLHPIQDTIDHILTQASPYLEAKGPNPDIREVREILQWVASNPEPSYD